MPSEHAFIPEQDAPSPGPTLEADLRTALLLRQFRTHWQPIVKCATGELVGFEALIRWDRLGHGSVSPSVFIPLLEQLDLFRRFDRWMLQQACLAATQWPSYSVAVNISAFWFQGPGLVSAVAEALEQSAIDPARLELEVSESIILEGKADAARDLERLKDLGVRLTLDDFGSGHASLGYLSQLPFDKLKLDQRFVRRLGECRRTEAIVRAVLQLATSLGLTVCAEGVERSEQLSILQAYGCEEVQGYLIGYPEHALPDMLDFYDRLDRTKLFMTTETPEAPNGSRRS